MSWLHVHLVVHLCPTSIPFVQYLIERIFIRMKPAMFIYLIKNPSIARYVSGYPVGTPVFAGTKMKCEITNQRSALPLCRFVYTNVRAWTACPRRNDAIGLLWLASHFHQTVYIDLFHASTSISGFYYRVSLAACRAIICNEYVFDEFAGGLNEPHSQNAPASVRCLQFVCARSSHSTHIYLCVISMYYIICF